jgi:hypothetical protein
MADARINGRISDGGVLSNTAFGKAFANKLLQTLPNSEKKLPFVFVGDDTFALTENFMKTHSQTGLSAQQQIFNYQLSRACRAVENSFGICFQIRCPAATYCAISSESPNNCLNMLLFAQLSVKKPGTNVHFMGLG